MKTKMQVFACGGDGELVMKSRDTVCHLDGAVIDEGGGRGGWLVTLLRVQMSHVFT